MPFIHTRLPGKTKGFFQETGPVGTVSGETFTCPHCNRIENVDKTKTIYMCEHCFAPICGRVECRVCVPFEKKLELYEKAVARRDSRASILAAAGLK